jgi:hypothetical protein
MIADGTEIIILPKESVASNWHNKKGKVVNTAQGDPYPAYTIAVDGREILLFADEVTLA